MIVVCQNDNVVSLKSSLLSLDAYSNSCFAPANERVLLMRLYLLQGIVAYHQNKRADAKRLLGKAETELNALRVS